MTDKLPLAHLAVEHLADGVQAVDHQVQFGAKAALLGLAAVLVWKTFDLLGSFPRNSRLLRTTVATVVLGGTALALVTVAWRVSTGT